MQLSRGYKSKLTLDFETNFNTIPDTKAGKNMPFDTCELASSQTIINPETISGTRNAVEPAYGHITADGKITIPLDSTAFGYWAKALFNNPTTVDNTDGTYTHTYKINDEQPSLVLSKAFPDVQKYFTYTGCKVGTFAVTLGDDGALTADMDVVGCDEHIGTTAYDASATDIALTRFNNFDCELKIDDTKVGYVQTMDFNIDNGLDDSIYTLGNKGRGAIPEGMMSVSGKLSTLFNTTELLEKAINGDTLKFEIILTNASGHKMSILMPQVKVQRTSPAVSGPAGVKVDVEYSAFMNNNSENSSLVVALTNETASY